MMPWTRKPMEDCFQRFDTLAPESGHDSDVIEISLLVSRMQADQLAQAAERSGCSPAQLLRKVIRNLATV